MTIIKDIWKTIYELDFTQQTTQTFTSDSTYTIDNKTWTKGNSANEITHAAITSSGLNFQPSSTSDYNGSTRTLPYMWLPFSQIFPNVPIPFGWNTRLRFYVSIGTDNTAANYDAEVFGFDSNSDALYAICKRGYTSGGQGSTTLVSINGINSGNYNYDSFTLGSGNKTFVLEISSPQLHKFNLYRTSGLSAGSAFPLLSTFLPAQITFNGGLNATASGFGNLSASALTSPSLMGIILGGQRASSGTSLSINFQRIRLDARFDD